MSQTELEMNVELLMDVSLWHICSVRLWGLWQREVTPLEQNFISLMSNPEWQ